MASRLLNRTLEINKGTIKVVGDCLLSPFFAFFIDFSHNPSKLLPPVLCPLSGDEGIKIMGNTFDSVWVLFYFLIPEFGIDLSRCDFHSDFGSISSILFRLLL